MGCLGGHYGSPLFPSSSLGTARGVEVGSEQDDGGHSGSRARDSAMAFNEKPIQGNAAPRA